MTAGPPVARPLVATLCAITLALASCDDAPSPLSRDASADVRDATLDTSPRCTPGVVSCADDARATRRCDPNGETFTELTRCEMARGELCAEGRCVEPCAWAASTHRDQGCEFRAAGTLNSILGRSVAGSSREDFPFAVALTNPWPVAVDVTLDGGGLGVTRRESIAPRGHVVLTLPWVPALVAGGDPDAVRSTLALDGSVRIRTTSPVTAYQFNPMGFLSVEGCESERCYSYSNDASLLLPTAALGRQYVVVTRPTVRVRQRGETRWRHAPGFVTIVGTSDTPTDVVVRLHARTLSGNGITAGTPGAELRQRLGAGDVLQLVSEHSASCADPVPDTVRGDVFCRPVPDEDLTGTVVTASAPVSVFAGHDCALVPFDRYACDHLEEQMLPVEALGRRYVVARTPPLHDEPDVVRVVATRPGTRVSFEPASAHADVTLGAAGDFVEFEQRESLTVTGSEPIVVAQFLVGGDYDPSRPTVGRGDPDMVLAVPIDQTRARYDFVAEPGFATATAIATVPQGETLHLDGVPVTRAPAHRVAGFDVYYLPIEEGPHTVESLRGAHFGLVVSGLAPATSYTYPAGLDLAPISPPL
jgi:IgGFc binding protein